MNMPQMPPRKELTQRLLGNQVQQAIYVAAKLGIADLLKDGPKRSEGLAQATRAHPGSLYRLMRALASFGIFAEDEQCRFELTLSPLSCKQERPTQCVLTHFGLMLSMLLMPDASGSQGGAIDGDRTSTAEPRLDQADQVAA